ncbi:MAG: hypothetical protein PQJ50_16190, partial [Spirochaetales bacterium]|nr:hypothetical protein [Spirochaetales bacterium]
SRDNGFVYFLELRPYGGTQGSGSSSGGVFSDSGTAVFQPKDRFSVDPGDRLLVSVMALYQI